MSSFKITITPTYEFRKGKLPQLISWNKIIGASPWVYRDIRLKLSQEISAKLQPYISFRDKVLSRMEYTFFNNYQGDFRNIIGVIDKIFMDTMVDRGFLRSDSPKYYDHAIDKFIRSKIRDRRVEIEAIYEGLF